MSCIEHFRNYVTWLISSLETNVLLWRKIRPNIFVRNVVLIWFLSQNCLIFIDLYPVVVVADLFCFCVFFSVIHIESPNQCTTASNCRWTNTALPWKTNNQLSEMIVGRFVLTLNKREVSWSFVLIRSD